MIFKLEEAKQKTRFFVTGTQVYGPLTEDSDLDIAIHFEDAEEFKNFILGCDIEVTFSSEIHKNNKYVGFHFELLDIPVNVIILDNHEFDEWKKRTEKLRKLPPIIDKAVRIATFNED